jgi:hypothetical protein
VYIVPKPELLLHGKTQVCELVATTIFLPSGEKATSLATEPTVAGPLYFVPNPVDELQGYASKDGEELLRLSAMTPLLGEKSIPDTADVSADAGSLYLAPNPVEAFQA